MSAHSLLETPAPRDQQDGYKDSSACGITRASTQPATRYTPGQALDVQWLETVDHSGCFVVEFSAQGDQDFQVLARKSHVSPPAPMYPTSAEPRRWSLPVTLPNVSCDECTLRLRQIMADEDIAEGACPPPAPAAGSVYTTCANISLRSETAGASPPSEKDSSGCSLSARRSTAWSFELLLAVAALGGRRRLRARADGHRFHR